MKLVDVLNIYKKLCQRESVTSEWVFVIRNQSRVQIFRIEIDFVILFALDFVSITKDLNSATVLEPWILHQWKLGILYQWELGHSLHLIILNKVLCYGSLGHTHNLYNKTICLKPLPGDFVLMSHNWQKWKRVFLTCPCHDIYRVEAVGLKNSNYTWKIMIFANMWNLGQFREKLIFCQ